MRHLLFKRKDPGAIFSEPNILTLIRLFSSIPFFVLALSTQKEVYNFIGFGIHAVGDILDGVWARKFKQETILGAEIDIIADRVELLFFFVNFLFFHPHLYIPIVLFILNFAFIDFYLSYQFVKFDIISPNYFFKVDRRVYLLNFTRPAKFINSSLVALLLIFLPSLSWLATLSALSLIAVKSFSIHLLIKKRHLQKVSRIQPETQPLSVLTEKNQDAQGTIDVRVRNDRA
ncbi:MAG: CDP-alcohol phosphatidyltransferase family protein [Clostridiales bacterium]|nr:CDP-alcohol phosphatidyltransferase family protein [Clostridiales bacterium]